MAALPTRTPDERAQLISELATRTPARPPPAVPPAKTPVQRIQQRKRFLLFDVIFHEQVNKQRRALMFYLDLAMRLKRTLVLPRTRLLRRTGANRFAPDAEYVGWGELFNVSQLAALHPVIELEQYLALHGPLSLHVKIEHKGCAEQGSGEVRFNGLLVEASKSVCGAGWQYDPAKLRGAEMAGLESLAFSQSVDQLVMGQALSLRPYVRFLDSTYDVAAEFVERSFGREPFIAIHWRRTDFLFARQSQPGVLQSAEDVVRHARILMQKHSISKVYLATDSEDKGEIAVVQSALQPARYLAPASTLRARTDVANIEISICSMAAHFLGTKTSSFSLAISEERSAIFGHASSTATDMAALPTRTPDERAQLISELATRTPARPPPAVPPAKTPVQRIQQRKRFLLFDVIFHEQVNKQRRALMFYLDLAMRLKRTLVLPRTRLLRRTGANRFAPDAEYVGWGELFNVSQLAALHPVIELEQYLALHGPLSLHVKIEHKGCAEQGSGEVRFNGLLVEASKSVCGAGWQYDPAKLRGAEMAGLESLAFSQSVDQLVMGQALSLRPYVRFLDSTYDVAAEFVERSFGREPFIAIHWRRTDFLFARQSQPGVLQSAEDVVRHARILMQKHSISKVYLATDSEDKGEIAVVQSALQPARYLAPASTLRARTDVANIEISICSMAAHFLGTKTSSFSLAISEERSAIFGHASSTTSDMSVLPPVTPSARQAKKDEL
eukprot:CAMPEP_0115855074 /NCGR_PEP_ID=MMETSP0287-20121206/14357_1 /TAXON_ID=412157 /ORGANISM="Chrysochromulina rotalis, Strain UIO044" /LENGTH=727 /DNA_ID=CAMNT_0003309221 /DNA_START=45 /DNA_END=2228 /DNA_ORIENTATION=+